jgi:hypothetical protein
LGGAALVGHPAHLAAVGAAVVGNNLMARALTSPTTARCLALSTSFRRQRYEAPCINSASWVVRKKDQDAQDLAVTLMPHAVNQMSQPAQYLATRIATAAVGCLRRKWRHAKIEDLENRS